MELASGQDYRLIVDSDLLFLQCFAKHSSSVSPFSLFSCYQQQHYILLWYTKNCEKTQRNRCLNFENDDESRSARAGLIFGVQNKNRSSRERVTIKHCFIHLLWIYPCLSIRIYNGKRFSENLCTVLHILRDLHQREVMMHMPISRRNEIGRNGNTIENEVHRLVGRNDHFRGFVNLVLMSERLPDR